MSPSSTEQKGQSEKRLARFKGILKSSMCTQVPLPPPAPRVFPGQQSLSLSLSRSLPPFPFCFIKKEIVVIGSVWDVCNSGQTAALFSQSGKRNREKSRLCAVLATSTTLK